LSDEFQCGFSEVQPNHSTEFFIMSFTLNHVVLTCLAETDLFAILALADASSMLHRFIHDQVLTTSLLRCFLQEHQYVLHHDANYFRLLPRQHMVWLYRAFEKLRQRDAETAMRLDEDTFGILYPLLGLISFEAFISTTAALPIDLSIPDRNWKGRSVKGSYTLEDAQMNYSVRLSMSWLHEPRHILENGDTSRGFYDVHESYAEKYLRKDFLFCKRYVDDFNTCYRILRSEGRSQRPGPMLAKIDKIREALRTTNLSLLVQKRCLQAEVDFWYLSPKTLRRRTTSAEDSKSLMRSRGWLEIWSESELGWWYSLGLWQYGPDCITPFIDQTFKDKRQALIWLFLGAHRWFNPKEPLWEEPEYRHVDSCCSGVDYEGCERDYLIDLVASLSWGDRIWTMRQIIRKAPEYGVCRSLGGNVFNYFVLHDLKKIDAMMCILLEEIINSPLQYLFEYVINIALAEYQNMESASSLMLNEARKFGPKLLRKNLNLYTILGI
jgi:hypothetical protein